jgi:hypothetical protein
MALQLYVDMALQLYKVEFMFGLVIGVVVTVLAMTAWSGSDWAGPIPPTETIYQPQHLNLY